MYFLAGRKSRAVELNLLRLGGTLKCTSQMAQRWQPDDRITNSGLAQNKQNKAFWHNQ